jgi:enoyl-CoA hydratase
MSNFIQFEKIKGEFGLFGHITLNRTEALNALNLEMIASLHHVLDECEKDNKILAVIIQSASEKAFCAGGDIRALYDAGRSKDRSALEFFKQEYQLNKKIYHYSKPYICFLNGITMGGGVGISLHGSHAVAGENFRFAMPETAIGLFPDIGGIHLLHQCPGVFGLYLALTGAKLGRDDAYSLNLFDYSINLDQQLSVISQLHHLNLREEGRTKVTELLMKHHVESTSETIFHRLPWINEVFSENSLEKIMEHFRTYVDNSFNAENHVEIEKIYNDLKTKSPMSLKVTFQQFQRTQYFSLDECLSLDYTLVSHFLQSNDLYEGIRALIIEKDHNPKWLPKKLEDISESMVNEYFDCIPNN